MIHVLITDRRGKDTDRREGHVKTEAEMREMQPQAEECLEPAEARGGKEASFLIAFRVSVVLLTS